jgi:hypothetical protein
MQRTARRRRVRMPGVSLPVALSLMLAAPLSAQEPPEPDVVARDTTDRTDRMVVGGLLGGTIGLFLGAAVGAGMETTLSQTCGEYCGLGGALTGAFLGESLGMAYGVHAGNRKRGGYLAALAGPIIVLAGSAILGNLLEDTEVPALAIVFVVPTIQLMTSISGERAAMRRRDRPPN